MRHVKGEGEDVRQVKGGREGETGKRWRRG